MCLSNTTYSNVNCRFILLWQSQDLFSFICYGRYSICKAWDPWRREGSHILQFNFKKYEIHFFGSRHVFFLHDNILRNGWELKSVDKIKLEKLCPYGSNKFIVWRFREYEYSAYNCHIHSDSCLSAHVGQPMLSLPSDLLNYQFINSTNAKMVFWKNFGAKILSLIYNNCSHVTFLPLPVHRMT